MDFRRGVEQGFGGSFPDWRSLLCDAGALRLSLLLSCIAHLGVMGAFPELRTGLLQGPTAGAHSYTLVARQSATPAGQQGEKPTHKAHSAGSAAPAQEKQHESSRPEATTTTVDPPGKPAQPARRTEQRGTSTQAVASSRSPDRARSASSQQNQAQSAGKPPPKQKTSARMDASRAPAVRPQLSAPARPVRRADKTAARTVEKRETPKQAGPRQPAASTPMSPAAAPLTVASAELTHLTLTSPSRDQQKPQAPASETLVTHPRHAPGAQPADGPVQDTEPMAMITAPSAGATFAPPRYQGEGLNNPIPRYPFVARIRGLEGRVLLQVAVSPGGEADKVSVRESSGHRSLDRAALEAVRRWHFTAGMLGTETVTSQLTVPVLFRLK